MIKKLIATIFTGVLLFAFFAGGTANVSGKNQYNYEKMSASVDNLSSIETTKYNPNDFVSGMTVEKLQKLNNASELRTLTDIVNESKNRNVNRPYHYRSCFIEEYIPESKFNELGERFYISDTYSYYINTQPMPNELIQIIDAHNVGIHSATISDVVIMGFDHAGQNPNLTNQYKYGKHSVKTYYVGRLFSYVEPAGRFDDKYLCEDVGITRNNKLFVSDLVLSTTVIDKNISSDAQLDKGTFFYQTNIGGNYLKKNIVHEIGGASGFAFDLFKHSVSTILGQHKIGKILLDVFALSKSVTENFVGSNRTEVQNIQNNPYVNSLQFNVNKEDQLLVHKGLVKGVKQKVMYDETGIFLQNGNSVDYYYFLNNQDSTLYKDDYLIITNLNFSIYFDTGTQTGKLYTINAPISIAYDSSWNCVSFDNLTASYDYAVHTQTGELKNNILPARIVSCSNSNTQLQNMCGNCINACTESGCSSCGNEYKPYKEVIIMENYWKNCPYCGATIPYYATCCPTPPPPQPYWKTCRGCGMRIPYYASCCPGAGYIV